MTDAIVGVLIQQLFTTLTDETNVLLGFQRQFDSMKKNLTYMTSFLTDLCELKDRKHNETVKNSLATLRELVYDADDILLDCQIQADYRNGGTMMHYSCCPHEFFFRYTTGKRLKEINIEIEEMENKLKIYLATIVGQKINHEEINNKRWTTHICNQSEIVGLSKDTEKIKQWILPENKKLQRVGIVGMAGLGKTTLTHEIFHDQEVTDRFQKRIWVSVSQTFTPTKIMKSMLEKLCVDAKGCDSEGMLLEKLQEALVDNKYLIVMDDVWNTENGWWEQISRGLPEASSSIIITTRKKDVAKCMGVVEDRIHKPEFLDPDVSWSLFCKVAFKSAKGKCKKPELETVGKEIVKKCHGLPLAIKTIGGLLSTKAPTISEWKKILDDFPDTLADNRKDQSVIASLQLSYDELPAELKHCILCFSIYPEDCHISAKQLVNWWVGEGFVRGKDRKTATERAFNCLSELYSRCLVEVENIKVYDGRDVNCKIHDSVRELIIRMAKEEAFCSFDDENRQKFDSESRHLGFTSEINTESIQSNSKLRALLLTTSCSFSFSPKTGLAKVNSLRVLDLSLSKLDCVCIEDLLAWISSQKRLAYLNLRGVASLNEVPDWIGNLRNLQILMLNDCLSLENMSPYITTLRKLTVLDIGNCPSLRNLPDGMGNLTNLQELSGFKLGRPGKDGCRLGVLKSLTKLTVLRINISEENDIANDELKVLSDLHHLRILSIDTKDCKKEEILKQLDQLSPPQCLQELYFRYYHRDITPNWVTPSTLPELRYLSIEDGELQGMNPSFWGSNGKHWKIQGLCLKYLHELEVEWTTVLEMMPQIEYVEVRQCYKLNFPFIVEYLGIWRKKEEEEITDEMEIVGQSSRNIPAPHFIEEERSGGDQT